MVEPDIIDRLNGIVRVPVNDGAGLLDGKDFFERQFPTSKLAREAAAEISLLRSGNKHMCDELDALRQRLSDAHAALRPFKLAADLFDEMNPRDHMKLDAGLTVGDLRGARTVIATEGGS